MECESHSTQTATAASSQVQVTEGREQPSNTRIPVRLVVCVDGTWVGPDGVRPGSEDNLSTVFKIWCCVKEGDVTDSAGKHWRQIRTYFRGVNNSESWYGKLLSGAFGDGVDQQIKDVYRICCELAAEPEDEIFFFGFSRGAFVVRAVANLLAYMKIPGKWETESSFDKSYKRLLDVYKDVCSGSEKRRGSIYEYMSTCRPSPKLQYIGVIDTVKAFIDDGLYEIGVHPSHRHCRHALALNETRISFQPELWSVTEKTAEYELRTRSNLHSMIEAWFLGSHGDLGGGNMQDGIALYPAQWLLSEARQLGLILDFSLITYTSAVFQEQAAIDNPLELLFPSSRDSDLESLLSKITLSNGVSVELWDLSGIHARKGLALNVNSHTNNWLFPTAPRNVFQDSCLVGYHEQANLGVIIHPSVYRIYDQYPHINAKLKTWPMLEQLEQFRLYALPDTQLLLLSRAPITPIGSQSVAKFRILVCGNAGVGKSTLINKIFGVSDVTQESKHEHGIHNINQGFSPDGAKFIVHDSCGFQPGQQDEVEEVVNFLKARSSSSDFSERLHAVLYCVSTTRLRVAEAADEEFFRAMSTMDGNVPVVIVATRIDEVEAVCRDKAEKSVLLELKKAAPRYLSPDEWDEVDTRTALAVNTEKQTVIDGLSRLSYAFSGPVFTSKDSEESVSRVVSAIIDSLTDDKIRSIFAAAQMCSLQPKIDTAIANSIRLYSYAVRTAVVPIAFSGLMATTTVTGLIVKDVLGIFQFNQYSGDMASHTISNLLVNNFESNGIYVAANLLSVAAAGSFGTGVGALAGVVLGAGSYGLKLSAVPQFGRLLLMCTIDTILIMERVFWKCDTRVATSQDIQEACDSYKVSMDEVHAEIKNVLPVWGVWNAFRFQNLAMELKKIVAKFRFRGHETSDQAKMLPLAAPSENHLAPSGTRAIEASSSVAGQIEEAKRVDDGDQDTPPE